MSDPNAGLRVGRLSDVKNSMLPPEAPLDMPEQDFGKRADKAQRERKGYWIPRAALFTGTGILTGAFAYELYHVLGLAQLTPIQLLFLVLSTIAFGWIALGSLSGVLGFLPLLHAKGKDFAVFMGTQSAQKPKTYSIAFSSATFFPRFPRITRTTIRIISARRATSHERRRYEEGP